MKSKMNKKTVFTFYRTHYFFSQGLSLLINTLKKKKLVTVLDFLDDYEKSQCVIFIFIKIEITHCGFWGL